MKRLGIARIEAAGITKLCERYAAGSWLYQLLSSFAHGKVWALVASELSDIADTAVPGRRGATVTARDQETIATTTLTMDALGKALSALEAYARL